MSAWSVAATAGSAIACEDGVGAKCLGFGAIVRSRDQTNAPLPCKQTIVVFTSFLEAIKLRYNSLVTLLLLIGIVLSHGANNARAHQS